MTETPVQPPGREPLPVHPHTKPLARWIEAIASWYNNAFGTPTAFAISLVALAGWVALIPILGFSKWNSGPGLLGNTTESTGEWFFGLAVLIVGVTSAARQKDIESNQHHQMDSMVEMLAANTAQGQQIADVEGKLAQALDANTALTQQVHDLTSEVHRLMTAAVTPLAPAGGPGTAGPKPAAGRK